MALGIDDLNYRCPISLNSEDSTSFASLIDQDELLGTHLFRRCRRLRVGWRSSVVPKSEAADETGSQGYRDGESRAHGS